MIGLPVGVPLLDDNGGAWGPAELAEAALERFPLASRTKRRALGAEDSDHRRLASLRLSGERRGEEDERYTGDERSPIHHSMT